MIFDEFVGWIKQSGSTSETKITANEVRHGRSATLDPPYVSALKRRAIFLAIAFFSFASLTFAQVKIEDTVKKPVKPKLPATGQAEVKKTPPAPPAPPAQSGDQAKLACLKSPNGCPTSFRTAAAAIAPAWYAKQEKDPKEAARSQQKAVEYLEKYKAHALKRGWEVNDIARAYAFFVSLTYNVYSMGKGPDPAQFDVMTKRIRNELSKDAKFQANGDRDRQFIYERLILVAMDNESGYVFAKQRKDGISQEKHRERAKFWLEDVMEKPVNQIPNYWN